MNRLSNYFKSIKLAKAYLASAEELRLKENYEKSLQMTGLAIAEMFTAMNNVASIAFNQKPKARKP